jgi:hypothetical protein
VKTNRIGTGMYTRSRLCVVLDEVSTILDTHNTIAHDGGSSGGFTQQDMEILEPGRPAPAQYNSGDKTAVTHSSGTPGITNKGSSPLCSVSSIINWNKSRRELCEAEHAATNGSGDEYGVIKQSLLKRIYDLRSKEKGTALSVLRHGRGTHGPSDDSAVEGTSVEEEYFVVL